MESAQKAYIDGDFLKASEISKNIGTFDGFILAAEALIIHGEHIALRAQKQQIFLNVIDLSEKSLKLQPNNPDALALHIRALGRYTQLLPPGRALHEGYGERIKRLLDTLLRLAPNSWKGHLGYGAWHAEIVVKGGLPGKLLFGASERKAAYHFNKTLELNRNSFVVNYEVAQELYTLNLRKFKSQIIKLLRNSDTLLATDSYERILMNKSRDLLVKLSGSW